MFDDPVSPLLNEAHADNLLPLQEFGWESNNIDIHPLVDESDSNSSSELESSSSASDKGTESGAESDDISVIGGDVLTTFKLDAARESRSSYLK